MRLSDLLCETAVHPVPAWAENVEITSLCCDSRCVQKGALFVALKGIQTDGHVYIAEALARGAVAVLCETLPPLGQATCIQVKNTRLALAYLAKTWFGRADEDLCLLAVTGTNGKTSTSYLMKTLLEQVCGAKVGLIGTNQYLIGETTVPAPRTTPDALTLHALLARMRACGCTHVVMEVSSHALALERVAGLQFAVAVFTNLTQDHLDFHGTMAEYRRAKEKLFAQTAFGIYHLGDVTGRQFAAQSTVLHLTYGIDQPDAVLQAKDIQLFPTHSRFSLCTPDGKHYEVALPLAGRFQVENALAAVGAVHALGGKLPALCQALSKTPPVRGRMEVIPLDAPYTVMVDYAHTPDSLQKILENARLLCQGRLLCLFGCGGDRDRSKRPRMGEIATRLADVVILTSDNPRTEDPVQILEDIAGGIDPETGCHVLREVDRRRAIALGLSLALSGDILLLCGKGHETYQEIQHERLPMDEWAIVSACFAEGGA